MLKKEKSATEDRHIMWNPNKNYLGGWDLPSGEDLVLTITSISWDDVENYNKPIKQGKKVVGYETESKRVVHFAEDIKPLICNEINAAAILKACDVELIKDYEGKNLRIGLYPSREKHFGEEKDVVRVRDVAPAPKEKEVLNKDHNKWDAACEAVKAEETTVDDIRKHYEISDEDFNSMSA